jgi:hypothetical protein
MASSFYVAQAYGTGALYLPDMARFLIDDLAGHTGPGWTIVDTYSSAAVAPHEIPADPTDMDSLAADNGWRTGTLVGGDYIILANNGARTFQVGLELQSSQYFRVIAAPFSGFDTGNDDPDMTAAGNWNNPIIAYKDISCFASMANYSLIADEDHFKIICEQHPNYAWMYCGNLASGSTHTGETHPMVITTYPNYVFDVGADNYRRIAKSDDTTEIALASVGLYITYDMHQYDYSYDNNASEFRLTPVQVGSNNVANYGYFGRLIGVWVGASSITGIGKGTMNSRDYAFFKNSSASYKTLVFEWDGATAP